MKPCCYLAREDKLKAEDNIRDLHKNLLPGGAWITELLIAEAHIRYCDALHAPSEPETKP